MLASVRGAASYWRVNEREEALRLFTVPNDSQILPTLERRHVKVKKYWCVEIL